jgi:Leucine-rich repeat (LRR) protein
MKNLNKARFCGLLCVCILLFFSCSDKEKKKKEKIVFQYPKDSLWRGIPMKKNTAQYKKNALPSYIDSILISAESANNFNYYAGVNNSEIPALLNRVNQQQHVNYAYLRSLGVPSDKDSREKLNYLNLRGRNLHQIPYELSVLNGLTDLQLSDNNISRIPQYLFNCRNLKKLDFSSNVLDYLPVEVVYLKNLEELSLRDNRLNSLPNNLSQLKNLKVLDLSNIHTKLSRSYNDFKQIPASVCQLPNLEKLFLEKLPIQYIPVNIVYLKNLKLLSLNGCNKLNIFNALKILSNMHQLQVLDISFTHTYRVPDEIVHLKNLKVLIWQEEGNYNQAEIQRIQALMPNTKIYSGSGPRPFLRNNSINTIISGY